MLSPYGNRVLITGGSRGIGLAYAEALSEAGCSVVLGHYQDGDKAQAECQRLEEETGQSCYEIDADVGDPPSARAAVEEAADLLGGLDIVVSNAGICNFTPLLDITDEIWQRHVDVNFSGGFWVAQTAAERMVRQEAGGRIVFTSSVGALRSSATQTHYCATKAGLHLLARGMAIELGEHDITVNCIAPGWIHTDINDEDSRDEEAVSDWLGEHCPAGRLGAPKDLKAAILFLTSKEAEYTTGALITVDGGWDAQL